MDVVNITDTNVFRAIGKPPAEQFDELSNIIVQTDSVIKVPRPIYEELGGATDEVPPSGSDYIDPAIREGWVEVADPIEGESSSVDGAIEDARKVMKHHADHPKTAVFEEDLSLIGLAIQLFDNAETIHINLFTSDKPLYEAARVVIPYNGYNDFTVHFFHPSEFPEILSPENFTDNYSTD